MTEICDLCGMDTGKTLDKCDVIYNENTDTVDFTVCDTCSELYAQGATIEHLKNQDLSGD